MDREAIRAKIRSEIRPFPHEARYPTGWNGDMTFAEIRDALMPSINRLMRYYRYVDVDIPDMIAHGFMRLWEELSAHPDLLKDIDQGGATKWVMYRSGSSHYKKFYRREMYLDELATRSGDPDEMIIDGHDRGYLADHARYTERVDTRIDIERAMTHLAKKYEHSLPHLAALYYITTSVSPDDAASLAGRGGSKKCWWLTSIVKPMREELSDLLEVTQPAPISWQDKLHAGEKQPLEALIERLETTGDKRLAATVHALSENGSTKSLMDQLDLSKSYVHYLRRRAHQELNKVYQCRVA